MSEFLEVQLGDTPCTFEYDGVVARSQAIKGSMHFATKLTAPTVRKLLVRIFIADGAAHAG